MRSNTTKSEKPKSGTRYPMSDMSKVSDDQLARLVVIADVGREFDQYSLGRGAEKLNAAAKRYGVDVLKIRAEAEVGTRKEVIKKLPTVAAPAPKKSAPKPAAKKAPAKKAAKPAPKKKGKK